MPVKTGACKGESMGGQYSVRIAQNIIDCLMRMASDLEDAGAVTEKRRKLLCDIYDLAKNVEMMERAAQEAEACSLSRVHCTFGK